MILFVKDLALVCFEELIGCRKLCLDFIIYNIYNLLTDKKRIEDRRLKLDLLYSYGSLCS